MQKYSFDIIGTHLLLSLDTENDCIMLFQSIEERLIHFEKKYSRFIEWNWLHNIIMTRHGVLDSDSQKILSFALNLAKISDGYFDPTIGKKLSELGYGNTKLEPSTGNYKKENGDYRDIEMRWEEVILHGDVLLEFGGVGKGYLIDILQSMIVEYFAHQGGISRYLINFGGDLYGKWGWRVGLESPFVSDEVIGVFGLEDDFFACSAGTKRKWGDHHHLIDPHTGEPAREVVASYIEVSGDQESGGMIADAYATTLCVMPWDHAIEMFKKTTEITGVIVRYDGVLFRKEGSRSEVFS